MKSRASIKGDPIHPMLVHFPIALYAGGTAALIGFAVSGDPFWYRASFTALLAGVVMGLLAAVFGLIDLLGVPRVTKVQRTGFAHAAAAMLSTVLYAGAGFALYAGWSAGGPLYYGLPLILSQIGFAVLLVAGVLGWKMIGTHHMGVKLIDLRKRAREDLEVKTPMYQAPPAAPRVPPPSNGARM